MLRKTAGFGNILDTLSITPKKALSAISFVGAGMLINKAYNKVKNDTTRRNIISDLHLNDPVLKNVPEEQLLEWYATIYHFAPKFSLDRSAVKEVLQNFSRFGRVDVNTLKMLAETEKAVQDADSKRSSWGDMLGSLAKTVTSI